MTSQDVSAATMPSKIDKPVVIGDDELSMEDILRIRALGINDLYFFARGILGYQDLEPRVHRDLCSFLVAPGRRKLVLMPRSHFKSTIGTVADSLRILAKDPNTRMLLANESATNAALFLEQIKQHILGNKKLKLFYDYMIPDNTNNVTWNKEEILLPRTLIAGEPSIQVIGVGGAVVSRHFNIMKFDDLIGEQSLESPSMMTKAISWLNHSVSLLIKPEEDAIHLIGTRWAYNDLYAHAMEKMKFKVFRRKAIVRNLRTGEIEPLFKSRFSLEFLSEIMMTDPAQWAAQYANDPSDVAFSDFQKQWLRFYRLSPDGNFRWQDYDGSTNIQEFNKLRIYMHVDPSMGESAKADETAVMTVGINSRGQVFILDAWTQRIDPLNLIEKIFEMHERYNPKSISIESNAYQKSLKYYIDRESRRRGTYLRIEDFLASSKKSKEARIRGALQPYFSSGMVFVRESQINFVEQYMAFGRTDRDHMMDALAQGPKFWKAPADDVALQRQERIRNNMLLTRPRGLGGYGL